MTMTNDVLTDAELETVTGGNPVLLWIAATAAATYLAEKAVEAKQSGATGTYSPSTNVGKGLV